MAEAIYKTTQQVFAEPIQFVVPHYQREYSWTTQLIDELLQDIDSIPLILNKNNQASCSDTHFMGLLVFVDNIDEETGDSILSLVDGQQRLSTLLLIAATMKDIITIRLDNPSITKVMATELSAIKQECDRYIYISHRPYTTKKPKLKPNINDEEIYEILVLSEGTLADKEGMVQSKLKRQGLSKKYFKAYQHIHGYLSDQIKENGDEYLTRFYIRYDRGVSFIPFTSGSDTDAFNLFECLNNRGMSLTQADLIKNKVLQRAPKGDLDKFEAKWSEVIGEDGILSGDKVHPFIRNFLMMKKGHIANSQVYNVCKDLLPDLSSAEIFLDEIYEYGGYFRDISEVTTQASNGTTLHVQDGEIAEILFLLNKTKTKQWQSLAFSAYSNFKTNKLDRPDLITILDLLLKICLRFKLMGTRFNFIEQPIPRLANSLYLESTNTKSHLSPNVVQKCIRELSELIAKYTPDGKIDRVLNDGYKFEDNDLAFIMLRLIAKENGAIPHGLAYSSTLKLTLEHVLPEKHQQFWGEINMVDELKYSLGNMLLVEQRANAKLSNRSFEDKKKEYQGLNPLDLVLNKSLGYQNATENTWKTSFIKSRELDLIKQLVTII